MTRTYYAVETALLLWSFAHNEGDSPTVEEAVAIMLHLSATSERVFLPL